MPKDMVVQSSAPVKSIFQKYLGIHIYPCTSKMKEGFVYSAEHDGVEYSNPKEAYRIGKDHLDDYVRGLEVYAKNNGLIVIKKNISQEVFFKYGTRPLYSIARHLWFLDKIGYWKEVKDTKYECLLQ